MHTKYTAMNTQNRKAETGGRTLNTGDAAETIRHATIGDKRKRRSAKISQANGLKEHMSRCGKNGKIREKLEFSGAYQNLK